MKDKDKKFHLQCEYCGRFVNGMGYWKYHVYHDKCEKDYIKKHGTVKSSVYGLKEWVK